MQSSTSLIRLRRLIVLGSVVACAAASAVGASASRTVAAPDVVERYAATHDPNSATAPDVVERYVTVHSLGAGTVGASASRIAAPDVVERYAATHDPNSATAPDVVERYLTVHSLGLATAVPALGTERIAAARHVPSTPSGRSGLDWGDFGIGAGAMLGLTLLVAGLSLGAVAMRHRGGRLETS